MVLYPAVSLGSINPAGSNNRPARAARALAQGRLSLLLALEIASTGRAATNRHGAARADPASELGEPGLGAPRIHGELLKLRFEVAQSSVARYLVKRRGPPTQGWRTFLRNHAPDICRHGPVRGPDHWLQTAVWLRDCTD